MLWCRAVRLHLDADQQFFRETTARFLDEFAAPADVRRLRDEPAGFEPDYWRRGAELGWTSLLVAEDAGGGSISGDGLVDLTLIAHEFGAHAAPGPVAADATSSPPRCARHRSSPALVAELVAGDAVASWASPSVRRTTRSAPERSPSCRRRRGRRSPA